MIFCCYSVRDLPKIIRNAEQARVSTFETARLRLAEMSAYEEFSRRAELIAWHVVLTALPTRSISMPRNLPYLLLSPLQYTWSWLSIMAADVAARTYAAETQIAIAVVRRAFILMASMLHKLVI